MIQVKIHEKNKSLSIKSENKISMSLFHEISNSKKTMHDLTNEFKILQYYCNKGDESYEFNDRLSFLVL